MADPKHARQVYEQWVSLYATALYRMAYRMVGQAATAEDLVQETFYHAWRSMDSLKDPDKARAWLYQILRFRYSHWLRERRRKPAPRTMDDANPPPVAEDEPGPLTRLGDQEALQQALDQLDDRFKTPFLLVFLEGMTCQEAADQLDVPLGTVLSRIHRARQGLRKALQSEAPTLRLAEEAENQQAPRRAPGA